MMPWIPVRVSASCGRAQRSLAQWRRLTVGDRVVLDQGVDDPVPVLVNGRQVGTAHVVTERGRYALDLVTWGPSS